MSKSNPHGHLPRLPDSFYRGRATVHWTMCLRGRATGWLTGLLHARLREVLVHAGHRYRVACPVYCLMPDHGHFLVHGLADDADQKLFVRFLRGQLNRMIETQGMGLQRQAYDHVLREEELERDAFESVAHYIAENPVRAGLVSAASDWPFGGTLLPGYPDLDVRREGDWDRYWKNWLNEF
jgi:putative transposase